MPPRKMDKVHSKKLSWAMVVCICLGIRKSELQEILKASEQANLEQVQKSCGAGTDCGACVDRLKQILETSSSQSSLQTQSCN